MSKILDEMRRQIKASGQTRYAIWKATGIDQGQLSNFMKGNCGLSYEYLELLAKYLKLEIIIRPQKSNRRKKP